MVPSRARRCHERARQLGKMIARFGVLRRCEKLLFGDLNLLFSGHG
jgi:hypothetical protein